MTLWLSIKDKIVRLKVRFDTGLLPGNDPNILSRPVYTLSFTNVGARPVTVTYFRWVIKSPTLKRTYLFTFPHLDKDIGALSAKFPCKLTDGEEGHVFHKQELPLEIDKRGDFIFPEQSLLAFWRIFTFSIETLTTVGKKFRATIPFKVRVELWKKYCSK